MYVSMYMKSLKVKVSFLGGVTTVHMSVSEKNSTGWNGLKKFLGVFIIKTSEVIMEKTCI